MEGGHDDKLRKPPADNSEAGGEIIAFPTLRSKARGSRPPEVVRGAQAVANSWRAEQIRLDAAGRIQQRENNELIDALNANKTKIFKEIEKVIHSYDMARALGDLDVEPVAYIRGGVLEHNPFNTPVILSLKEIVDPGYARAMSMLDAYAVLQNWMNRQSMAIGGYAVTLRSDIAKESVQANPETMNIWLRWEPLIQKSTR